MRDTSISVSMPLRRPRSSSRIRSVPPATIRARSFLSARIFMTSSVEVAVIYYFHMGFSCCCEGDVFLPGQPPTRCRVASSQRTLLATTSFNYCPLPVTISERRSNVSTARWVRVVKLRMAAGSAASSLRLASTLFKASPIWLPSSKKAASN